MAARHGVVVSVLLQDEHGRVAPDRYRPMVSTDIRVYWPPRATDTEIMDAMNDAIATAFAAVTARLDRS